MEISYTEIAAMFAKPKAKIDWLRFSTPRVLDSRGKAEALVRNAGGVIKAQRRQDTITVHDPSVGGLQFLLDHYPAAPVTGIEVAIDWTLVDGSSDLDQLMLLHGFFRHRLFPQRHALLRNGTRRVFDHQAKKYLGDSLSSLGGDTTFIWRDARQEVCIRLYRKYQDQGKALLGPHLIRLEVTLERGGCQRLGLHRVAELPVFANLLRRELSDFLYVAAGIKPRIKRSRCQTPSKAKQARQEQENEHARVKVAWRRYGASWAGKKGYQTYPDTAANRAIGVALKNLRDQLLCLKLTQKVAPPPCYEVQQSSVVADLSSLCA